MLSQDFINYLSNHFRRKVKTVYLSGSEVNGLKVKGTQDKDLFVFVQDDKRDILKNKMFSKQSQLEYQGVLYDVKAYDLRKLYSLLIKSNFNVLELFGEQPLYAEKCNLNNYLSESSNWKKLASFNLESLIHSLDGMTASILKRIDKSKIESKEGIKSLVQAIKCQIYLESLFKCFYLFSESVPFDLKVADYIVTKHISLKELKESAYDNHLSKNELEECLSKLKSLVSNNESLSFHLLAESCEYFKTASKSDKKTLEELIENELINSLKGSD